MRLACGEVGLVLEFDGGLRARGERGEVGVGDAEDILKVWRRYPRCFVKLRVAASASAMTFRDFSRSRLSWAASAISDARKRRFSTYNVDIWAFSSSIRRLSVELSFVMCLLASRNFFLKFSNSKRASFCLTLMETRDSLLLIVGPGDEAKGARSWIWLGRNSFGENNTP